MTDVRIRIAVGSARIEYEGSRAFFERAIAPLVDALAGATPGPEDAAAEPRSAAWTPASPQHFVQFASQVGGRAATPDQRLMAFAFYLWNFEKVERFTSEEANAFFRTLQEEPPEDLAERLETLCAAKRFLESAGEDQWQLSTKGVNYVKNRLLAGSDA